MKAVTLTLVKEITRTIVNAKKYQTTTAKEMPEILYTIAQEHIDKAVERALESAHANIQDEFHKYRKANFDGTKVSMTGKEMNEIIRLGKIKTKREHIATISQP